MRNSLTTKSRSDVSDAAATAIAYVLATVLIVVVAAIIVLIAYERTRRY